jgi:hypothetical protein
MPGDPDILYNIPFRRRDYEDFFKNNLIKPAQSFSEAEMTSPSASAPASPMPTPTPTPKPAGSGRVRGGWIQTDDNLINMTDEDILQIALDDGEINWMRARRNHLRNPANPAPAPHPNQPPRPRTPPKPPRPSAKGGMRGGNLDNVIAELKRLYDKIKRGMDADLNGSFIIMNPKGKIAKNIGLVEEASKGLNKYLNEQTVDMVGEIANTPYLQAKDFLKASKAEKRKIFSNFAPNDSLDLIKAIISMPPEPAPKPKPSRPMTTEEARREAMGE